MGSPCRSGEYAKEAELCVPVFTVNDNPTAPQRFPCIPERHRTYCMSICSLEATESRSEITLAN